MPYLTGNNTPSIIWCSFPFPDDAQFLAAFQGAIEEMGNAYMWQQEYDDATPEEAAEYARYAYENRICSMTSGLVTGVRVVGTTIQTQDAQGNWSDAGDLCVDCNTPSPVNPTAFNDLDHVCAGVQGLVNWMVGSYVDWLDSIQIIINQTQTVAAAFEAFVETLTLGAGELLPYDEIIAIMIGIGQSALDTLYANFDTVAFRDDAKEQLYCLIKTAGDPYSLTESLFIQWTAGLDSGYSGTTNAKFGYWARELLGYGVALNRYAIFRADESAQCEIGYTCGESGVCTVFDFTNVSAIPNHTQMVTGTFIQGTGLRFNTQYNAPLQQWEARLNWSLNNYGTAFYVDYVTWVISMNEPSTLGNSMFSAWYSEPFTIMAETLEPAQIFNPVTLQVQGTALGDSWFIPSCLSPRRDTQQEIDDAEWTLLSCTICSDAAGAAYLQSSYFQQHPL